MPQPKDDQTAQGDRLEQFPLFKAAAYDFDFVSNPSIVGLRNTDPLGLKRKIAAILVSDFLGLKSIDYAFKRYTKDQPYPAGDPERLDLRIERFIIDATSTFEAQLFAFSCELPDAPSQTQLAAFALGRLKFSSHFMILCAHAGAMLETASIARMLLEKLAWSYCVSKQPDEFDVYEISATKCIRGLKEINPCAGRFYGWLSEHVHWSPETHLKSINFSGDKPLYVLASSFFKAKAMLIALCIIRLYFEVFHLCFAKEFSEIRSRNPGWPSRSTANVDFDVQKIALEILEMAPDDEDISMLASFCSGK